MLCTKVVVPLPYKCICSSNSIFDVVKTSFRTENKMAGNQDEEGQACVNKLQSRCRHLHIRLYLWGRNFSDCYVNQVPSTCAVEENTRVERGRWYKMQDRVWLFLLA